MTACAAHAKERARKTHARRPSSVVASRISGALDNATPLTEAEDFSVSAELAKAYLAEADEFLAWHAQGPEVKSIVPKDPDHLDDAAVRYLALLQAPRLKVVIHVGEEPRGYKKEQHPLELTKEKVVEPLGRRFPRSAVVYHPLSKAPTSKSSTTNDTVMLGLDGKAAYVFTKTSTALYAAARPGKFPLRSVDAGDVRAGEGRVGPSVRPLRAGLRAAFPALTARRPTPRASTLST